MLYKKVITNILVIIIFCFIPFYAWGDLLGEGNILVSTRNVLYEYTESGTLVQSYAIPSPPGTSYTESARDIVSTNPGEVLIYNGTFDPFLTTLETLPATWSHETYQGWSTVNNGTYGGIAASEDYIFVTDMKTYGGGGDEAAGVVRFNRLDGTAQHFANNREPIDLTLGLDGLLYVLYPGGSPGGRFIDVFDPETLSFVRIISLAAIFGHTAHRAVAVNENGEVFIADWDGDLQKLDSAGNILIETSVCGIAATCSLYDIDVSHDGRVVMGDRSGGVTITDENFSGFSRFNVGTRGTFVAFVPFGLIPPKILFDDELNQQGCIEAAGPDGAFVTFRGENRNEQEVEYSWTTSAGDYGEGVNFSINITLEEDVLITLEITDVVTGDQVSSSIPVCVSDTVSPNITILAPYEGEIFVGKNMRLEVEITDSVDLDISNYEVFIGNAITAKLINGYSLLNLLNDKNIESSSKEITVTATDFSGNSSSSIVNIIQANNLGENDGIEDIEDNCPLSCNELQLDADGDGIGDVCDDTPGCGGCGQPSCEQ
jgi:hypothetical protein